MTRKRDDEETNWLLDRLLEDTEHPHLADHMLGTAKAIRDLPRPPINPAKKASLTMRLIQERRAKVAQSRRRNLNPLNAWPVLLILAQIRVVERGIWAASALALAVGAALTVILDRAASLGTLPFALLAPLVAAFGIAFLYAPDSDSASEIERGTAASFRLIWLARLALVFGFDLILGVAASFALSLISPQIAAWPLVATWLAPMALLSALAFAISVWRGDSLAGVFVSLMVWVGQVARLTIPKGLALTSALPDWLAVETRLWAVGIALALIVFGVWFVGRDNAPAPVMD